MSGLWLVTGATGLLGPAVLTALRALGRETIGVSLSGRSGTLAVDFSIPEAIDAMLVRLRPERIVHLAALANPAAVDHAPGPARQINIAASAQIARWCRANGSWLLHASTDWVFDGRDGPHDEQCEPSPGTVYGRIKREAEVAVLGEGGTVARLGWLLDDGTGGRPDFIARALAQLRAGETVGATDDEQRSPITVSDAASAIVRLGGIRYRGVIHIASDEACTPFSLLRRRAVAAGLDPAAVVAVASASLQPANRPRDVRLDTSRLKAALADTEVARLTIIVPVHDGAHSLGATLAALATQIIVGVEVIVVVNGARDTSAAVARAGLAVLARHGVGTRLIVLDRASRAGALDAGDAAADPAAHRLYLDQDAVLSPGGVARILDALDAGAGFVAARAEFRGGTRVVRAAMRAWNALPYVRLAPVTAGTYAVSVHGRRRWGAWPADAPDDKFARLQFASDERCRLDDVSYAVDAPVDFAGLVAARRRYGRSHRQLRDFYPHLLPNDRGRNAAAFLTIGAARWPGAIALAAAIAAARLRAA